MDQLNNVDKANNRPTASDTTVEQPQQPQAEFEQQLADARPVGPIYPHRELHDVTEEDDRLIQAASGAALERGAPGPVTVSIYDRLLRKFAEALKQSGKSIAGLDEDTLLGYAKKLLPNDKIIAPALSMVSRYREPGATARLTSTHYRPSNEDERLIRQAAEAGFARRIGPKTALNYASSLRKLAVALRPLSIAKLGDDTLLGYADTFFRNDRLLIFALNGLRDYRATTGQGNWGAEGSSTRQVIEPAAPSPMRLVDGQRLGNAADRTVPLRADGFNTPQLWQGPNSAAHSPIQSVAQDVLFDAAEPSGEPPAPDLDAPVLWPRMHSAVPSPLQSFAQEALFDAADREALLPSAPFDAPVLWPTINSAAQLPVQSVAQDDLFDAVDWNGSQPADGLEAPEFWPAMGAAAQPPVQTVGQDEHFGPASWQPSLRPQNSGSGGYFDRMIDRRGAATASLEQTFPATSESFDASLAVPEDFSHGTQPAPDMMRSKLGRWGLLPDAAQRVKTYDIRGERYTAVLGPGGPNDVQLIHLRSPAVGDTFDISFAVPKDFSHRTQLAPDMMLSTLGKWDFLPVAEHPVMNYEIGGERYTAMLGPGGPNDVQLIHHPRPALLGEASPAVPRASSDIYGGLALGFDSAAPFEWREDAPSALAPNLPPPSAAPASGHQPFPQAPELGELFGDDWRHGPREASPVLIDMLQNLDLLPSQDVPMTRFLIHGQPYTAESLPRGRVLLFHRPQFG
ncbi:hypothetical protein [Bradyrhizobium australiense]|uniref:Uncharacterized protein n=1 Tax=Bradyrhizobium australiense TaxID=2721161 RepID=A0A7Y4LYS8_9BRAD|nr:hypothetical protein [Bradyrhizobium australiense]NOJ43828.1 hypothetical protein [Bradyrhizobium australiense]